MKGNVRMEYLPISCRKHIYDRPFAVRPFNMKLALGQIIIVAYCNLQHNISVGTSFLYIKDAENHISLLSIVEQYQCTHYIMLR
jgi:hypothetical protein